MSKRTVLFLSVLVSLALHVLLLLASRELPVLRVEASPPPPLLRTFQVKVVDDVPPVDAVERTIDNTLASRQSDVRDLLNKETEELQPEESLLQETVEVPQLSERLATDPIAREHYLEVDEATLEQVDSKIIEISEQTAREDIQIARRLVTPSPDRILDDEELPTLRGGPTDVLQEVLLIAPPGVRQAPAPAAAPEEMLPPAAPEPEKPVETPAEAAVPDLPEEAEIARAQISSEIESENRYEFIDDLVDVRLETFVPADEERGFFRLQIVPKDGKGIAPLPKDITLVVDASSSIIQRKLSETASGAISIISGLRPEDRFNVIVFRDTSTHFQQDVVPATPENKEAATRFLSNLQSYGQTNLYEAIRPVVLREPRQGIPNIVLVLSDGRPSAGIRDARTIINNLTSENVNENTIVAFGGGNTVNQAMLDLLAYRNKGECVVIPQITGMRGELPRMFSRFDEPLLVDLNADFGRIDEEGLFPRKLPDFYRDQAVTVYGRFDPKKDKEFAMRLTGLAEDREKEVVFKADLTQAAQGGEDIARDWAFRKIYHLIGETYRVGETPELMQEREALSKKYGIRTIYD